MNKILLQFQFFPNYPVISLECSKQKESFKLDEYKSIKPQNLKYLYKEIVACLRAEILYKIKTKENANP